MAEFMYMLVICGRLITVGWSGEQRFILCTGDTGANGGIHSAKDRQDDIIHLVRVKPTTLFVHKKDAVKTTNI